MTFDQGTFNVLISATALLLSVCLLAHLIWHNKAP